MAVITILVPTVCWGLVAAIWCRRRLVRFGQTALPELADRGRPDISQPSGPTSGSQRERSPERRRRHRSGPIRLSIAVAAAPLVLILALVHPILAAVAPVAIYGGRRLRSRARQRRMLAAVVDQVPDLVDLLRLTTLAGLPVGAALVSINGLPGGPLGPGLRRAVVHLSHGATTVDALHGLAASGGPPLRPLVEALVDHDRYGTPLGPALDRVGIEARLHRRRSSEEAARRLPVTLLFPLVFTTLPACGLLTVIPLLVASLSSLQP